MLLNKLREYADERMTQLPPLYAMTPVAWIVAIDSDGYPLSSQPISRIDPNHPRGKRGLDMVAPEIQRFEVDERAQFRRDLAGQFVLRQVQTR